MTDSTPLGFRLRAAREAKGWSRETLARATGTSALTILRAEIHGSSPRIDTLTSWAEALDVSIGQLLAEEAA